MCVMKKQTLNYNLEKNGNLIQNCLSKWKEALQTVWGFQIWSNCINSEDTLVTGPP